MFRGVAEGGGSHRESECPAGFSRPALLDQVENSLHVAAIVDNPAYAFISENAKGASRKYGVKSVSILATKP